MFRLHHMALPYGEEKPTGNPLKRPFNSNLVFIATNLTYLGCILDQYGEKVTLGWKDNDGKRENKVVTGRTGLVVE
jgi:hypothetical protein